MREINIKNNLIIVLVILLSFFVMSCGDNLVKNAEKSEEIENVLNSIDVSDEKKK